MDRKEFQEFLKNNRGKRFTLTELQQQRRENQQPEIKIGIFLALLRYTDQVKRDYQMKDGQLESVFQIFP